MKSQGWATAALGAAMLAAVTAATPAIAKPAHSGKSAPARYYLALGDSLSVGYQPNAQGVGHETNQGYSNQLYAALRKRIPALKLVELGCPGDTTGSMLTGKGNAAATKLYHCDHAGGSQLKAAERFLSSHHRKGEVALVTLDIGANDVDGCTAPGVDLETCFAAGAKAIKTDTPKILKGIRAAAAKGIPLDAMNLYDPVLASYLDPSSPYNGLAEVSTSLLRQLNSEIQQADDAGHFKTADVAGAFQSYNTTPIAFDGQQVPTNVVRICQLTWECAPAPQGPNIHANQAGYGVIAGAFKKVLGKLG